MSPASSETDTAKSPKPDLAEHEAEDVPLEDVLRKLLDAKPAIKPSEPTPAPSDPPSKTR